MEAHHRSQQAWVVFAFAVIYIVWGSTYLGIKVALETLPPFLLAGVRFVLAGLLLLGWAAWRGEPWPGRRAWVGAGILGLLMFVLGNGLVVWAETRIASGLAAIIAAGTPLWVVMMDHWRPHGRRATAARWVGVVLGITGLTILFLPDLGTGPTLDLLGAAAVLGASLAWALGSIASPSLRLPRSHAQSSGATMLTGGVMLLALALATGEVANFDPAAVSLRSALAWLYLMLFGSILAFTCFTFLLSTTDPAKVATSGFVNPIVALLLGWSLGGEEFGSRAVIASAVTLAGLALILWPAGRTFRQVIPVAERRAG